MLGAPPPGRDRTGGGLRDTGAVGLSGLGRLLVIVGVVTAVVGVLFVVGARFGLGRLPGDLSFRWGSTRVFAPLATGLVVSVVLTIVLNVLLRR